MIIIPFLVMIHYDHCGKIPIGEAYLTLILGNYGPYGN